MAVVESERPERLLMLDQFSANDTQRTFCLFEDRTGPRPLSRILNDQLTHDKNGCPSCRRRRAPGGGRGRWRR